MRLLALRYTAMIEERATPKVGARVKIRKPNGFFFKFFWPVYRPHMGEEGVVTSINPERYTGKPEYTVRFKERDVEVYGFYPATSLEIL